MRRTTLIFLIFFSLAGPAKAQLGVIDSITSLDIFDMIFFNPSRGVIAADSGEIWITTNGGTSWNAASTPDNKAIRKMWFKDQNQGFAVGDQGTYLYTIDAGNTWLQGTVPVSNNLNSIQFANDDTGIITGESGVILRTTDGGSNWSLLTPVTIYYLSQVHFFDDTNGLIIGGSGTMLWTADAGSTWTAGDTLTTKLLADVYFLNQNVGYMCGDDGVLFKTENGGVDWDTLVSGTSERLLAVDCRLEGECLVSGENGTTIKANNDSWELVQTNTSYAINDINLIDDLVQFGVGNGGTILKSCPVAGGSTPFTTVNHGKTLQFVNESENETKVKWYFGDGDSSLSDNPLHAFSVEGTYWVKVWAFNETNCTTVDSFVITVINGIHDPALGIDLVVGPNPARQEFYINMSLSQTTDFSFTLTDLLGRSLWHQQSSYGSGDHKMMVDDLPKGMLILTVQSGSLRRTIRISSH
jgi:photosystem II stability/assembly factor-like uncharacterized protein